MPQPNHDNLPCYEVRPVGYVRANGEQFCLEILEPYRPALKEMRQFSHILVFWWAHEQDAAAHRATLTTELPYAPGVTAGVFACRSPYRPNPIAQTAVPVLAVDEEKGLVILPWIDANDGTPVLDLKPYIPLSDRIRDVRVAKWLREWPDWMEDAGEFFARNEVDFGG